MLQLVLDKNGNYVYQDVAQKTVPSIDTSAFEAYEANKKTTLAGDTDIGSQTEQLIRETPGQYTTTFNEETGQFETKQKDQTTPVTVDVKPIEQTTVQPQETPLDAVSRISAASRPAPIDYKGIAKDTMQMFKPTFKEKVMDTALSAGKDIAVSYVTNRLLANTFAGSLAATTMSTPIAAANPYAFAATQVLGSKVGKKAVKKVTGIFDDVVDTVTDIIPGKVVCTMMNDSYGFGSFRNAIWLRYAKQNLTKQHEIGYHKIFLPLVKFARQKGFINKIVKNILEHIAIHRTIDIRKEEKNKIHLLGRVYRKMLEPICYWVGR
jgi:hypothetical protein